jgi:hypothetical protein
VTLEALLVTPRNVRNPLLRILESLLKRKILARLLATHVILSLQLAIHAMLLRKDVLLAEAKADRVLIPELK